MQAGRTERGWRVKNKITQVIIILCGCIVMAVAGSRPEKNEASWAVEMVVEEAADEEITDEETEPSIQQETLQDIAIEDLLTYEIRSDEGREYVVLTGIKEAYRADFSKYMAIGLHYASRFSVPDEISGVPVEEIAADAFRDITRNVEVTQLPQHLRIVGDRAFLNTKLREQEIIFPGEIEQIGEQAFENCGISRAEFPGEQDPMIGRRAFANNKSMWAVYLPTSDCLIGEEAFAGCEEKFYLGYRERMERDNSPVEQYAAANGLTGLWVPVIDSLEPVVRYPKEPLILKPEIGNYFYGENGEGEHCLSGEEADDAPDYGYPAWHAPCGEWCVGEGFLEITASSELPSSDGRYAAGNLYALCGRESAWAEGVEGNGIGESITYHDCNDWHVDNRWDYIKYEEWYLENENMINPLDGYIRYTQICIVNGYARDQKTWEENGRIKTLLMYVEDKPYARLELEDTIKPQYFTLPWEDVMIAEGGDITFRFVIEDVYPGVVYKDTCLTGLVMEFTGRRGH